MNDALYELLVARRPKPYDLPVRILIILLIVAVIFFGMPFIGFLAVFVAVLIALAAILVSTCVISVVERGRGHDFLDLLFETTSAFSTTGLSSVNTTTLTPASQWLLMPLMYFGRVGPLTLAYALANRLESRRANRVHYPEEKIMIG